MSDVRLVQQFDLSALNLEAFQNDHWLSCPSNVIVLHLTEKAYLEPQRDEQQDPDVSMSPQKPGTPQSHKRRWNNSPKVAAAGVPALPFQNPDGS